MCLFLKKDNVPCGLIGQSASMCACRTKIQFPQFQWGFSGTSSVTNFWDICQMCTFIMSSTFFTISWRHSLPNYTSPSTPLLLLYEYSSNSQRWCQPFLFFYPSSRSSFPECFLGALELQWHCRSRVGVAETRCRSSLGDFSQSIASVSSQMICTLWAFRSGGFLWALINTRGEFANADFSLDVWSSCRAACKQNIVAQKVRGFLIGLWIRVIGACTPTESYPICSVFCVSSPASLMMILEHLCRRQQSPTHKKLFKKKNSE